MPSINKVTIIGHLGADPEIRYMPNGEATITVSIATTDKWKDRSSGDMKEKTEWHRVKFFRRLAEIVGEYLTKGSLVYIEGQLRTQKWTDRQGTDRYTTEIIARDMKMLSTKPTTNNQSTTAPQESHMQTHDGAGDDDNIPF